MESTLRNPVFFGATAIPRTRVIAYWVVTTIFCLQMGFTAYAQLRLPQVAAMFSHLGFPDYFRAELSWAKFIGIVLLLAPVPSRFKEWAYAHFAMGDGPEVWIWAAGTSVLWVISYACWLPEKR